MITACLKRMYDVAISLSSLRNIHTYRNTHTLTTPLSILTSLLLVHIPAFSSFYICDFKGRCGPRVSPHISQLQLGTQKRQGTAGRDLIVLHNRAAQHQTTSREALAEPGWEKIGQAPACSQLGAPLPHPPPPPILLALCLHNYEVYLRTFQKNSWNSWP